MAETLRDERVAELAHTRPERFKQGPQTSRLKAGAAEAIITPPVGAPTLGTIQRSTGVHDDLHARALVLNDGKQRVAILSLDLIGMDFDLSDEIRDAHLCMYRHRHYLYSLHSQSFRAFQHPMECAGSALGYRTREKLAGRTCCKARGSGKSGGS